jgi:hypothetical protein
MVLTIIDHDGGDPVFSHGILAAPAELRVAVQKIKMGSKTDVPLFIRGEGSEGLLFL